jgi:D-aspartate ligase
MASPGVLLTNGGYYGTLAAARNYGRAGLRVVLADSDRWTQTSFSDHISERLRCPARENLDALAGWLEGHGREHPGQLLYPCSDDLCWLLSEHRERLSRHFAMFQPPFDVVATLLNKERLYRLCWGLGIATPATELPATEDEAARLTAMLSKPYLIKPKMQAGLNINKKAELWHPGRDLAAQMRQFRRHHWHQPAVLRGAPGVAWPMLQEYHPEAATRTISVAGFAWPEHDIFVARVTQKVLQYPLKIGVGLCFEEIEPPAGLIESVRGLCQAVGYFGAFEVEFIRVENNTQHLLIDFNPRFYGQMQFEIASGLPIPSLVRAGALGDVEAAARLARGFEQGRALRPLRFSNQWLLGLVMTTQWLGGRVGWKARAQWLGWRGAGSDQVWQRGDRAPLLADVALKVHDYLHHPRAAARVLFGEA